MRVLKSIPSSETSIFWKGVSSPCESPIIGKSEMSSNSRSPERATAISTAFSSWRTFPGQSKATSPLIARWEIRFRGKFCSAQYFLAKWAVISGISSLRCLNGMTWIGMTFSL